MKNKALRELGARIYSNKLTLENIDGVEVAKEERELKEICNRTFGCGVPSPENLHKFNSFLLETVEEIVKPKVNYILGLLADFDSVPAGTIKVYKMPKTVEPKLLYTAKGTGVDLVRIDGEHTIKHAVPQTLTYGAYYEITTFMADPVEAFKNAVDKLAQAQLDFYFDKIFELMAAAIGSGDIPANNVATGANLGIDEFQKVENTMIRLSSGRPVFVGDIALINSLAVKASAVHQGRDLLTDEYRKMLRDELVPSQISKSVAIPFPNHWIDEKNSQARFKAETGFMFPGAVSGKKPFVITEFGSKRHYSEIDPELEQVKLKVVFEVDVTLLNGRYLGSITDTNVRV